MLNFHETTHGGIVFGLADIAFAAAFFSGTLIFPAGFIVGAVGRVSMFIRNRRRSM